MCGYQYPVMVLHILVGLSVQASKETSRKLKFNKLLSLTWYLWWIFIGTFSTWQGMKAELNYFSSLALNIFLRLHTILTFIAFSLSCIISAARWIFNITFPGITFTNKRWDFNCSSTFERVLSTCVFFTIHTYTQFLIRNLYSTLYLIMIKYITWLH